VLKPVHVSGVTVTHATLHNQDELERKDVRIGDTVILCGAPADVIPEVVGVIPEKRPHFRAVAHSEKVSTVRQRSGARGGRGRATAASAGCIARRSAWARCCILPRAAPWTSKGWVTNSPNCW